jgi:hypothetical protein
MLYRSAGLKSDRLLGESNACEAWTDGATYLAINSDIVKRINNKPLETVAYIFGLVEHEVAHQGDSLDCGHDEAFYQRFHDISLRMAPERQRFMHKWLMKYTMSMEREGKKATGHAWNERWLVDRVGSGRQKRGLSPVIVDVSNDPIVIAPVPEQNIALLSIINASLTESGLSPMPPDWNAVREQALRDQAIRTEELRVDAERDALERAEEEQSYARMREEAAVAVGKILGLDLTTVSNEDLTNLVDYFLYFSDDEFDIKRAWESKDWEDRCHPDDFMEGDNLDFEDPDDAGLFADEDGVNAGDGLWRVADDCRQFIYEGENYWLLERNAAAAGFSRVEPYLKWRHVSS